jgi:predicted Zn-dependent protease
MQPGEAHREELLSILNRGVLVTRFHYVSPVDPLQTVFTGMTRDGTFWIENGRIQRPLRNLRFTQSFLQAFERVRAISADTLLRQDTFGAVRVPAVILEKFNFSGVGEF